MLENYSVFGVGAALVDTEVRVNDAFLATAGIDKGVMTLVDEPRQAMLLAALESESRQLVRKCGGSVCNSIVAISSLGGKAFFCGKVAKDSDGSLYAEDLKSAGVNFQKAAPEQGTTGKCLVMVTDDAERTMNTFLGVSEDLSSREIDEIALCASEWLYLEGYLVTDQRRTDMIDALVKTAKKNEVKVAVSLSDPFVAKAFGASLRQIIGTSVDLIFCNIQEALAFTGTADVENAVIILRRYAATFVITDGARGAFCCNGHDRVETLGIAVDAIDTNGAGDMFAGAFLHAVTSGRDYQWAVDFANDCAARIVQTLGPRLGKDDFDRIKKAFDL